MEENKSNKVNNTTIALQPSSTEVQFSNFTNVEQMLDFGRTIVKSKLTPLGTPEAVMAAILAGKELGFGVMTSVNNIYPINGVATSGVHIINALILKAGVTYKVLEDYTPLYSFTGKDKVIYSEDEVLKRKDLFQVVTSATPADKIDTSKTMVVRNPRPVDYKTTIELSRQIRQPDGSYKEINLLVTRTANDYRHLWDTKENGGQQKSNWITNMKGMLFNRTLAVGSRMIADDVTLGLYLTEEIKEGDTLSPAPAVTPSASEYITVETTASEVVEEEKSTVTGGTVS